MDLRCGRLARSTGRPCPTHVIRWPGNGAPFDSCYSHAASEVADAIRQQRMRSAERDGTPPPPELANQLRATEPVRCSCQPDCTGRNGARPAPGEPPAASGPQAGTDTRPSRPRASEGQR